MSISFDYRLRKLRRKRDRIRRGFLRDIKAAYDAGKPRGEIDSLWSELRAEVDMVDHDTGDLVTEHLRAQASRLIVPIPDLADGQMWVESPVLGQVKHLTPTGVVTLRNDIRDELRRRREMRLAYLDVLGKLVVMLTGLVGAAIGLVTVWRSL